MRVNKVCYPDRIGLNGTATAPGRNGTPATEGGRGPRKSPASLLPLTRQPFGYER